MGLLEAELHLREARTLLADNSAESVNKAKANLAPLGIGYFERCREAGELATVFFVEQFICVGSA